MPEQDPRTDVRLSIAVLDYHERFIHHDNGFENIIGLSSYFLKNVPLVSFERLEMIIDVLGTFQTTRFGQVGFTSQSYLLLHEKCFSKCHW